MRGRGKAGMSDSRYPPQYWPEWKDSVERQDIYRQRILGNDSGANNFITVDDKRRMTPTYLAFYIIFFSLGFVYMNHLVPTKTLQPVVAAIRQGLTGAMFETEPVQKNFYDIATLEDLKKWVTDAFPVFLSSGGGGYGIQGVNLPLNPIRFTVRRIKDRALDPDDRFYNYAPRVWEDYDGVAESENKLDDTTPYGYSRQWFSLKEAEDASSSNPIRYPGLKWRWSEKVECSRSYLQPLDILEFQNKNRSETLDICKEWCENLQNPQPCVCWTLSGQFTCTFFSVKPTGDTNGLVDSKLYQDYNARMCSQAQTCTGSTLWTEPAPCGFFVNCLDGAHCPRGYYTTTQCECHCDNNDDFHDGVPPYDEDCVFLEPMCDVHIGKTAYWMELRRFVYEEGGGYQSHGGFVQSISSWPDQYDLLAGTADDMVVLESAQAIANDVGDWIAGNYLSLYTSLLTIDFVSFNSNYDVFVWVRLHFEAKPSGFVTPTFTPSPLHISRKDNSGSKTIYDKLVAASSTAGPVVTVVCFVYVILLAFYVLGELYYVCFGPGVIYFLRSINYISLTTLSCQVLTLFFYIQYIDARTQRELLANQDPADPAPNRDIDLEAMEHLFVDFEHVMFLSGLALLSMSVNGLRYLNDCIPRVHVLIDTIVRAWNPIFWWMVIIGMLMLGFVWLGYLMFGHSVKDFDHPPTSLRTVLFWLFGEIRSLEQLRERFPIGGSLGYFMPYMMILGFILFKFPTAVILVSYQDADERHKHKKLTDRERQRAEESSSSDDKIMLEVNRLKARLRKWMPRKPDYSLLEDDDDDASFRTKVIVSCIFVIYTGAYIVMTYMMIYVPDCYQIQSTIKSAVETPTYTRVLPVTGYAVKRNFSQIDSREDVTLWITQALPQVMYQSSSNNTLWFGENPLKTRSPPSATQPAYEQLLIADWNIVIGQQPFRISSWYSKMKPPPAQSWGEVFMPSRRVPYWGDAITPFKANSFGAWNGASAEQLEQVLATTGDEIVSKDTQTALQTYCRRPEDLPHPNTKVLKNMNGWSCMLNIDQAETQTILDELIKAHFINNQSLLTVIDFAIYNGYTQAFAYSEIIFRFDPSGQIHKNVFTQSFRMDLYTEDATSHGVVRLCLEILVIFMTLWYMAKMGIEWVQFIMTRPGQDEEASSSQKLFGVLRSAMLFIVSDFFTVIDFMSFGLTLACFILWYKFVGSTLRMRYFFPDSPLWTQNQHPCDVDPVPYLWCSDEEVLAYFKETGRTNRDFITYTGFSIIVLFFRSLNFMLTMPRVRMMWKSIESGLGDISLLVVIEFLLLMGFMSLGRQWYGIRLKSFSTFTETSRFFVSVLFGHIDYEPMRDAQNSTVTVIFLLSYIIVTKILFLNAFVAILDRHFRAQQKNLPSGGQAWFAQAVACVRGLLSRRQEQDSFDGVENAEEPPVESQQEPGEPSTPEKVDDGQEKKKSKRKEAEDKRKEEKEKVTQKIEEILSSNEHLEEELADTNWPYLPADTKTWARETAKQVAHELHELMAVNEPANLEDEQVPELKQRLKDVESLLKAKVESGRGTSQKLLSSLQREELKKLKKVHLDQESLAWFIAAKEKELNALKAAKEQKELEKKNIEKAARALVRSDEDAEDDDGHGLGTDGSDSEGALRRWGNSGGASSSGLAIENGGGERFALTGRI